jgi:hypothetical protein
MSKMREGNNNYGTAKSMDPHLLSGIVRIRPGASGLPEMQGQNGQNLDLESLKCIFWLEFWSWHWLSGISKSRNGGNKLNSKGVLKNE